MNQSSETPEPSSRRSGLYIGRWFGIRFYLDYSWFLVAVLVVYTLATGIFPIMVKGSSEETYFFMAIAAALLFFFSILLHELGHSLVSSRCGIPVPRITLLFIGGVAEISHEPEDPVTELKIALAGPGVSALLVILFGIIAGVCESLAYTAGSAVFSWLALTNLTLILFNAVPGYPLDGGRVLRAILWKRTGNMRKATYVTSRIGVGFAWVLMILGLISLFQQQWTAFILLLVGIFLKSAAESGYLQALYHEVLAGVRVRDIMTRDPVSIPAHLPVNLAVNDYFFTNHHVAFPVCGEEGEFRGLLRLDVLKDLPREKWPYTHAGDLLSGPPSATISADESAVKAMRRLLDPLESRLAVLQENRLVGILTRHDILKFIQIHSELET